LAARSWLILALIGLAISTQLGDASQLSRAWLLASSSLIAHITIPVHLLCPRPRITIRTFSCEKTSVMELPVCEEFCW